MSTYRNIPAGSDPDRHVIHALAALREAVEHLEAAAAAEDHPTVRVASALSHVTAARGFLRAQGVAKNLGTSDRHAA